MELRWLWMSLLLVVACLVPTAAEDEAEGVVDAWRGAHRMGPTAEIVQDRALARPRPAAIAKRETSHAQKKHVNGKPKKHAAPHGKKAPKHRAAARTRRK